MIRYRHGLLFAIVALSGCQTMSGLFPNRFASTPEYSPEEILALSEPLPAATSPELAQGVSGAVGQNANPVSLASYNQGNSPQQAGRMSGQSLVEAGQQAIREAGPDNPAGLQKARQLFQQAIGMDATNADAHHGIAIAADLQKDWMAAEQHYKQALSGDPSNPNLLNDLGYSYLLQNRYHESLQYLNQAIQISPKHKRAHLNLALLSLRRGDANGARQTLAKIFSQQDIGSNLARLQQDLLKLNANSGANNAAMTAGLPQNGANAVYPIAQAQAQPSNWNANRPAVQNFGQANPAYSGSPTAADGIQRFRDAGGSMAIDPALRVSDSQPVSLYPPGVVRDEVMAQQNGGFSAGQQMPQNGAQAMANAGYPNQQFGMPQSGMQQPGNQQFGGQAAFQAFPAANANGMQMPSTNNSADMMNQYPLVNAQPASNQSHSGVAGGMNVQGGMSLQSGFESASMGLNVGPGMPFPIGGASGMNAQQSQFNTQSQNVAQPLLNQYDPAAMGMPSTAFGQSNHGQMNQGSMNAVPANYGQLPPNSNAVAASGQGQLEVSQFPAHRQPSNDMQIGRQPSGQLNTQSVSYGQPVGAASGIGQANYGQPNGFQNQPSGQVSGAFHSGANQMGAMNGQQMYPDAQPQQFGQGMNSGMGNLPNGMMQGGMPATGMQQGMNANPFNGGMQQGGPMQQFEQQQMNRINDQYQQALQQMNGRGFPGQ